MLANLSKRVRRGSTEIEDRPVEELVRQGRYVVALRVREMFEDVRRRLEHGDLEGFRVTGEVLEPVTASPR